MKKLFINYFLILQHPFKNYEGPQTLSFVEMMSISWIFKVLRTIYYFVGIHFTLWIVGRGVNSKLAEKISGQKIVFYWVLVGVIFYPLILWLLVKFWMVVIRFFSILYAKDDLPESYLKAERICNSSLASQFFLAIPLLGEVFVPFVFLFLLFAGLRKSLNFTVLQALLVLLAPLFIFILFVILTLGYFILLFSMG